MAGNNKAARAAEEDRLAAAARAQRVRVVLAGVIAALVVAVATFVLLGGEDSTPSRPGLLPKQQVTDVAEAADRAGCELNTFAEPPAGVHTTDPVTYAQNPPVGGPHHPQAADGLSDATAGNLPPVESLVHSLEHGRIQFQFRGLSPMEVDQMRALLGEDTYHTQLFENPTGMPYKVAATAWGRSVTCARLRRETWDALRTFRDEFRDQAPEQVP